MINKEYKLNEFEIEKYQNDNSEIKRKILDELSKFKRIDSNVISNSDDLNHFLKRDLYK